MCEAIKEKLEEEYNIFDSRIIKMKNKLKNNQHLNVMDIQFIVLYAETILNNMELIDYNSISYKLEKYLDDIEKKKK